ncbi:unnamed protein product [Bursaphelenchus xylophilus]|uniref:(pine wood nematode) hypothetical protein n=1 Tax=Bursaphelenchus xylophilus TaxID=6326 RepID=A0A1I7RSN5_BURXY|nr:unnamed protein product [Bursaphelenchus xylophilus]CAG9122858.1 unnamed protein product [Bursaphelenchus xylophilus]
MIRPFVLLLALLIVQQINAAKKCYSGQNQRYAEKQCSSGGLDLDYACQTFTCEGGKSPFTLRTCARKNIGCIAGPRICQFSGGKGKCGRCDGDLYMGFGFVALCYLIALIAVSFCIFFAIYTVICIDELKTDYKNPISQCDNLNKLILPEYVIQMVFTFLFICSVQLFAIVWNLPLVGYHIYRYINRPIMREPGIYDPTTILNNDELKKANREGWIKLGFYLISFFYYLYAMIYTLVSS